MRRRRTVLFPTVTAAPLAILLGLAACGSDAPTVPLAHGAPWPKFRADARQTGRGHAHPSLTGGALWTFPTGKGVFSSPVVAADGTIYIGSADRTFYAINPDGTKRWSHLTGEIIDSAALLDDQGKVYVASGDSHLYAFDAATGDVVWTFAADAPGPVSIINWFEGNVAMEPDGTLVAGNDNFHLYGVHRDGTRAWATDMPDQTWSSPAIDPASGQLFVGNNALLSILGANLASFDHDGQRVWRRTQTNGSVAASPLLTEDGAVVVGGFDGYVRAIDTKTNQERWSFGTRDHVYASAAEQPDGTLVVPSADGTIYALDPATGAKRWAFDTLEPIRSSPAIDADGNVYVGSGEGRLFVLNKDGTLRWAMRLIDDVRNDLNASPALGADAIYLAGESGAVFSVPYDYCLRPEAAADARCTHGGGEDLPADDVSLYMTTPLGAPQKTPPATIDANRSLTLSLIARKGGDTELAVLDTNGLKVTVDPPAPITVEVSADRRFVVITPDSHFAGGDTDDVTLHVTGTYLVDPDRDGLKLTGGKPGGAIDQTFKLTLAAANPAPYALAVPAPGPGGSDAATALEMYRLAAPLPTVLPSYNQIGFDSLHYLVGVVEGTAGHYVAWVVGGRLDDQNHTIVDPASKGVFALEVDYRDGAMTLRNDAGFSLEAMSATLTFEKFRVSARVASDGTVPGDPAFVVSTKCQDVQLYGPFLGTLGLCNPDTDTLLVSGGLLVRPYQGGVQHAPTGVGAAAFSVDAGAVHATLTGSTLKTTEHKLGLLLVDDATGKPLALDYGLGTTYTLAADGTAKTVDVALKGKPSGTFRAYLMVDTYPAARGAVTIPAP
jgi:outer membrane protein assembly factor BamB